MASPRPAPPSLGSAPERRQRRAGAARLLDAANGRLLRFHSANPRSFDKDTMTTRPLWAPILFSIMALFVLAACATSPPVQEMSDARQAISAAEEADADRLAPVSLGDARRFLAEAEGQLKEQAWGLARVNALRAKNRALQALQASETAVQPDP